MPLLKDLNMALGTSSHVVVCLIPGATFRDLANDIEEVILLERELLGSGRAITTGGADDLLRGKGRLGFET